MLEICAVLIAKHTIKPNGSILSWRKDWHSILEDWDYEFSQDV